ncbi:ankyrin [Laetiporus sulphureus 93-53]|uniref:Ankyrin n=1 Tax=Laetiporus sulphureus 93-53 TaxID=1314785 RepID=A0A165DY83_9APHY|nr:ankyrin [Laetiporus sulphureus 93-53]KZT05862.1 ankyrin [Laetiporus sulphureus 93-53]
MSAPPPAYVPSQTFQDAASYLSSATMLSKVPNTVKLELYGLFKYLTVSHSPDALRPSIFDMTGRAKWDAWSAAGKTYSDRAPEAEARYLAIARELGWKEDMVPPEKAALIDDLDIVGEPSRDRGGGGGGMGNSVSVMDISGHEQSKTTLSRLAISGNVRDIASFLDENPDIDVNAADENGYTSLHLACDRGHVEIVRLLLSRGADPSIKDADDLPAVELAEISGHQDIVDILNSRGDKPG